MGRRRPATATTRRMRHQPMTTPTRRVTNAWDGEMMLLNIFHVEVTVKRQKDMTWDGMEKESSFSNMGYVMCLFCSLLELGVREVYCSCFEIVLYLFVCVQKITDEARLVLHTPSLPHLKRSLSRNHA